jgi:hypothetical protein
MFGPYPTQPIKTQPIHLMGYFMYVKGQNIQPTSKMRDYHINNILKPSLEYMGEILKILKIK